MNFTEKRFTLIGGGIAGLTTAIALRRVGIRATVFEAAPALRPIGAGLALAANAIKAFRWLGIADEVVAAGRLLDSFAIYDPRGQLITRTDSRAVSARYGLDNFAIHRAALHQVLRTHLDDDQIVTGKKAVRFVSGKSSRVTVHFEDGSAHQTDYLLVADGIHSALRRQLLPESQPRYAGYTCWRAIIDSTGLALSDASETWGPQGRVGLVPLAGNQLYWFACLNGPANDDRLRRFTPSSLARQFGGYAEPIGEVLARTKPENLLWNDILDLKPLAHYAFGPVLLLGDAAHATTPNMGQGACQAIEDAVVLADELRKGGDVEAAFARFEQRRLKRTRHVTETSRRIGQLAQAENALLVSLRNFVFRRLPERVNEKQLETLYRVDF